MFNLGECFVSDFENARSLFLITAKALGAKTRSYKHSLSGPRGEELATDVATFGNPDAKRVLLLVSGTHGVEGYCGSGLQVAHMRSGLIGEIGHDLTIKMVHALNPYGFAFKRRVNEDNVDLNRNFVEFNNQRLRNVEYDDIHDLLMTPPTLSGRLRRKLGLTYYIVTKGMRALQAAVTNGQYQHPNGLFYGGKEPSWSRNTWDTILQDRCASDQRVLIIDYHTGLGKRAAAELIAPSLSEGADSWRSKVMRACFGSDRIKYLGQGNAVATKITGDLLSYTSTRKGIQTAAVCAEFGTLPPLSVLDALIDENWAFQNPTANRSREQPERLLRAFSPNDAKWRQAVWNEAAATTKWAIKGLREAA